MAVNFNETRLLPKTIKQLCSCNWTNNATGHKEGWHFDIGGVARLDIRSHWHEAEQSVTIESRSPRHQKPHNWLLIIESNSFAPSFVFMRRPCSYQMCNYFLVCLIIQWILYDLLLRSVTDYSFIPNFNPRWDLSLFFLLRRIKMIGKVTGTEEEQ